MAGVAPGSPHFRAVVVDECIGKIGRVVAHRAITAGVLVNQRVRRRGGTVQTHIRKASVVAGNAVPGDALVRERRRRERGDHVTAVTILVRRDVIRRFSVERGSGRTESTIVAAFTAAGNACVLTKPERCRPEIRN